LLIVEKSRINHIIVERGRSIVLRCALKHKMDYWTFRGSFLPPNSRLFVDHRLIYIESVDYHNAGDYACHSRAHGKVNSHKVKIMGKNLKGGSIRIHGMNQIYLFLFRFNSN